MNETVKVKAGAKKAARKPLTIPADATVKSLARAMWGEIALKSKGRVEAAERGQLWKKDQKEYTKLARRVVSRLSRRARQGKARDKRGEAAAAKA